MKGYIGEIAKQRNFVPVECGAWQGGLWLCSCSPPALEALQTLSRWVLSKALGIGDCVNL